MIDCVSERAAEDQKEALCRGQNCHVLAAILEQAHASEWQCIWNFCCAF